MTGVGPIYFVTGTPGSGKSTTCSALMQRFPLGVHVSVDALRDQVVSGFRLPEFSWPDEVDEQFRLARESASHMARLYAVAGFAVAIDDCLGPQREPRIDTVHYGSLLEDPEVHRVLIRPRLDVVVDRNRSRGNGLVEFLESAIPTLYDVQATGLTEGWKIIDTSELSVDQTVERIIAATVAP